MKNKRPTLQDYETQAFKSDAFKAEYEALRPEFDLAFCDFYLSLSKKFIKARQKAQAKKNF